MNTIKRTVAMALLIAAMMLSGCAGNEAVPSGGAAETGGTDVINEAAPGNKENQAPEQSKQTAESHQEDKEDAEDGLLTVTFLDVGQGNAVLVENDGLYMLIDGGDRDYSSYVVSYLKKQGVEKLEYAVSSHYDADHLNGVIGALHVFTCDTLLAADYVTDTKVYQSLLSVIDEKDISVEYPDMGDTYTFGDAEFTIVCPDAYDYSQDNDNSIGIRLAYGEHSFLICGDAGKKVEEVMINSGLTVRSDVYLASHHGSAGSSSKAFLEAVQPKAVVISAGMGNSYGHPTEEVLSNIQAIGASLYRTDLQGEIIITSDGTQMHFNAEPCTDFRDGEQLVPSGETTRGTAQKTDGSAGQTQGGEALDQTKEQQGADVDSKDQTQEQQGADADFKDQTQSQEGVERTYILNRNTKKFHVPSCSSVSEMNPENKAEFNGTREEAIAAGYASCGRCHP